MKMLNLTKPIKQTIIKSKGKFSKTSTIKMRSLEKPFTLDEATSTEVLAKHEGILKLVVKRFLQLGIKYNITYDELLQVGRIGLIRGYEWWVEHKPEKMKISTILAHSIEWDLLDYLYSNFSVIRIPKSTLNKKMEELKLRMAMLEDKEAKKLPSLPIAVSIDNETEYSTIKLGQDPYENDISFLREELEKVLDAFTAVEQVVIKGIYFDCLTFAQLAEDLSLTKEKIKHIKDDVIKKMRKPGIASKLKEYYE